MALLVGFLPRFKGVLSHCFAESKGLLYMVPYEESMIILFLRVVILAAVKVRGRWQFAGVHISWANGMYPIVEFVEVLTMASIALLTTVARTLKGSPERLLQLALFLMLQTVTGPAAVWIVTGVG